MPGNRHWFQWPAAAIVNASRGANKAAGRRNQRQSADIFASSVLVGCTKSRAPLIGAVIPLRANAEDEAVGLDLSNHGEEAYVHGEATLTRGSHAAM